MPSDFSHAHDAHERARQCVTHHDACDCGKARHRDEIASLRARVAELEAELAKRTPRMKMRGDDGMAGLVARAATGPIGGVA
jgi:hypothetical protein